MSVTQPSSAKQEHLERNALGVPSVVFLVLAAAAPLGAMLGSAPFAMAFGNGPGVPGTFVLAALALACFAAGYAAMSRRITNAGAFYAYIGRGLGRTTGVAAAHVAWISYLAVAIGVFAIFGIFAHSIFNEQFGIEMEWYVWALLAIAVVGLLAYRRIELSAKVLGVCLVAEALLLLVMDVAVLSEKGLSAFSLSSFSPEVVFSGSAGVAILFVFTCFIGFEGTAIYAEETKEPKKTVSRATFITIAIIGVFYAITSWSVVSYYGNAALQGVAEKDTEGFIFAITDQTLGTFALDLMQVLLCISFFASALGILNSAARYLFALGREGILPRRLSKAHPRHESPYIAVVVAIAISAAFVLIQVIGGGDPYLTLAAAMLAFGTVGIVALQGATALAAAVFFIREKDRHVITHVVLPLIGAAALLAACYLGIDQYSLLTGSETGWQNQLPWVLVAAALFGVGQGLWLRRNRPQEFDELGESVDDEPVAGGELAPEPSGAG
ncbi:MAG: hypothetical protein QOE75_1506 [Solirubrobacterales bacterium]|jgi:amino acid transporter|nr:hypothetical protein [Solirubrobacterales bacterium]